MITEINRLHNEMLIKNLKANRAEREMKVLLVRYGKANDYLSSVIIHPENWHDHKDAIGFAMSWVLQCAQQIADYNA